MVAVDFIGAEVAQSALGHGMLVRLPLELNSRNEPYEIVTRRDVELTVLTELLIEELTHAEG